MDGTNDVNDGNESEILSVTVAPETKRAIRVEAAQDGRTMSELLREVLADEFGDA